MKRAVQNFLIIVMAVCLPFLGAGMKTAWAAGERVYFGSENYEWELGQTWLFGTYAGAEGTLEVAEYTVVYDPEMLEFVTGGELLEPGKVRVSVSGIGASEFKRLMNFTPLMAGDTEIAIQEAALSSEGAETVEAEAVSVPIHTAIPDGCRLTGITVNDMEVSGFDADTTDYTLELENYAEHMEISLQPEGMDAWISDETLVVGENEVHIITTDGEGRQARYTLHINCPEPPVPASAEPEENVPQPEDTGPEADQEGIFSSVHAFVSGSLNYAEGMINDHRVLSLIVGALVVVFIALIAMKVRIRRKRRRAERERRRRIQENQARKKREAERKRREAEWEGVLDLEEDSEYGAEGEPSVPEKCFENAVKPENVTKEKASEPVRQNAPAAAGERKALTAAGEHKALAPAKKREDSKTAQDAGEDEIEINVKNVTMDFRREKDESTSIKELVIRTLKRQRSFEYFRALDNISFTVKKGEVVGIIGTNGSGKSTILKIISGVLAPTKGKVEVDKRKIQLLTLGTGFDHELTGRENVYLNGAIIGYTKEYIDEKYDDIVKFAELEGFMEEKVRNYSSGMVSRLGFAIATARDTPEILILDEVLSVGDMFFRKKSEARIQEMIHGGSTVLIVSHSTGVIKKNCTKAVWIEKGKLRMVGEPKEVCAAYEKMNG